MKILFSGIVIVAVTLLMSFVPRSGETLINGSALSGDEKGIRFIEPNWSKALAEAKKQNKLIFLDAYTTWCGPCKLLKKNTFPDSEAGEFFNKNFINVAIDMEKGDGPALSEKFQVTAYPTLIIADGDGNLVTFTRGYIEPRQLIDFGKHGLSKKKK